MKNKMSEADPTPVIPTDQFICDPEYIAHVKTQQTDKTEEVRKSLQWSIEYHEMAIKKLKDKRSRSHPL